jgi:LacI family transcriptional regulator
MAHTRVTLRDVARQVGVHPSTVSRVLNPATRGMVSPEIAERVTEAARTLGYRPNPIAYGLRTNRSFTIGVVLPDLTNPVFPPMVRGIEATLEAAGYTAIIANTDNDPTRAGKIIDIMRGRQVDGLIVGTARLDDPLVAECQEDGIPLVLINRRVEDGRVPSVAADSAVGMSMVVRHLVGLGHRRIAHIAGPQYLSTGRARLRGVRNALAANGLPDEPAMIAYGESFTVEEGRRCGDLLMDNGSAATAIVCANDLLAIGCYESLAARGLTCPADISVTGYNDIRFMDKLRPPLTTVRIPTHEIGAEAARTLLARMRDPATPPREVRLDPELMVRGSTGPAKADGRSVA